MMSCTVLAPSKALGRVLLKVPPIPKSARVDLNFSRLVSSEQDRRSGKLQIDTKV